MIWQAVVPSAPTSVSQSFKLVTESSKSIILVVVQSSDQASVKLLPHQTAYFIEPSDFGATTDDEEILRQQVLSKKSVSLLTHLDPL